MRFSLRNLLLAVALMGSAFAVILLAGHIDEPMRKVPAITLAVGLVGGALGAFFSRGLVVFFISALLGFVGALYWGYAQYVGV